MIISYLVNFLNFCHVLRYYLHNYYYIENPSKNTTAMYGIHGDPDFIYFYPLLDEDSNNFLKINEIDSISRMITGEFNVDFISDSTDNYSFKFSKGWFEVPYP